MKRWSIIILTAAIGVWIVVDAVREFSATLQYYSTEPRQLLYVAAMTLGGGLAALGFRCLPPRSQRHVRVFAWGAAASTFTAFVGWFVYRLASLAALVIVSGGTVWVLIALMLFSGIAVYLWFEFYRAWMTGKELQDNETP